MLNPQDIDAIRKRAEKATAGPWNHNEYRDRIWAGEDRFASVVWDMPSGDNCDFIAHARTDIPALLAHVEELEARLASLLSGIA